ncbi:MAG: 5'-methylthioadenosine phosphorylase [Marinobacter vinifirmus]|uniref:5'-methylthioadenosine phosphorylase n=1 Tax=Marinobacter vinifirmus TaxID=355591 RepID=A0A558BH13_9GAMM|nr:CsiV family protein [Marinobacter vinifirmus]TVT35797.1 MAG: 5'-methylthioadenosine phosphorylase [Marinobacter vinifirmus]
MQARDLCFKQALTAALALAFVLVPAGKALAQTPDDFYRAEVVIVERLADPSAIEEQMAGMPVEPPLSGIRSLWVEDANGNRASDVRLAARNELYLNQAAARLENSGNYRVLATAGWYQTFPPNYNGSPMRVAVGKWLGGAGERAVEGHIEIDRQRYLHVKVHLNHWQEGEEQQELITWIRETRRMRSEEIHFIDSPTVGVLVFFRKIEG